MFMQEPEGDPGQFRGLNLDQIKGIVKSENGEDVFNVGASLVMDEGQEIVTFASENANAVVINEQLTKAKSDLEAADKAETDAREKADKEIIATADALAEKQSSDNSDRKDDIESEADRAQTKEAAIEANLAAQVTALQTESAEEHAKRSEEIAAGDAAIQKQIDFLLEGSTENLDQVVEIVNHICNIDVANSESLASAVASLTAKDAENRTELDEAIATLSDKQAEDNTARKEDLETETKRAQDAEATIEANMAEDKAELQKEIKEEVDRAQTAEDSLQSSITALSEKQTADNADRKDDIDAETERAQTKEAAIEANLAAQVASLVDADAENKSQLEVALKSETERAQTKEAQIEANMAEDKSQLEASIASLSKEKDADVKSLEDSISTAVANAVQNDDFTQSSVSLAGQAAGSIVSFEVSGQVGVVLVFANGLYVPSTTSYDAVGGKTEVSFEMFFDGAEGDYAHYMTVDFS